MLWDRIEGFIDRVETDLHSLVGELKELAVTQLNQSPRAPAHLFGLLRGRKPILVAGNVAIITKFADVQEVLSRGDVFTVPHYQRKMEDLAGPFILGMGPGPQYDHDAAILDKAIRRDDMDRVSRTSGDLARRIVADTGATGRLDVVAALADPVAAEVSREYFGALGPDQQTWIYWSRYVFQELFLNLDDEPETREHADAAAAGMRLWTDNVIAARKASGEAGPDDIIGRLIALQADPATRFTDLEIRTNVLGFVVGCVAPISKATILALEELLNRPEELAGAQQAARDGDIKLVSAYVFEALRFNPHNPGVVRHCAEDVTVAQGTDRETVVPRGALTVAATQSAMFDEDVVPDPEEFRTDRPWEHYLHFGYAQHTCGGEYVSRAVIPQIAAAILRQKNLRRAGEAGRLSWRGPYPRSMTLEFDPE